LGLLFLDLGHLTQETLEWPPPFDAGLLLTCANTSSMVLGFAAAFS
jgi:hypothetical protein